MFLEKAVIITAVSKLAYFYKFFEFISSNKMSLLLLKRKK